MELQKKLTSWKITADSSEVEGRNGEDKTFQRTVLDATAVAKHKRQIDQMM